MHYSSERQHRCHHSEFCPVQHTNWHAVLAAHRCLARGFTARRSETAHESSQYDGAILMRPWFIVTGDFTLTGGMDRANFALADRLARRGIPVHLVAHRVDEHLSRYGNVTIHHVPRPGGMHFPASFLLKRTATAIARRFPNAIIVGNGG